ncbi:MAG TPA: GGDEF domain-containing protein [Fimbriimonadaceae bacterium]|nr:GGDEF domain-containing protein [Fimbriimonadaceae bacterium]
MRCADRALIELEEKKPKILQLSEVLANQLESWYEASPKAQGAVDGLMALYCVLTLDFLFGFLPELRAAYVVPIYFAARKPHVIGEALTVMGVTIASAGADAASSGSNAHLQTAHLLCRLAVYAGLMVLMSGLQRKLKATTHQATHDSLTGAANRLAAEEALRLAHSNAERLGEMFSVAVIDCDEFKILNDQLGHGYGDKVLISLVHHLRRGLPKSCTVGRIGGDEFIVIMPNLNKADCCEALRRSVRRFEQATIAMGRIASFSFGVAEWLPRIDLQELVDAADADMYGRKAANRGTRELRVA